MNNLYLYAGRIAVSVLDIDDCGAFEGKHTLPNFPASKLGGV
jgi:hypothetical protein